MIDKLLDEPYWDQEIIIKRIDIMFGDSAFIHIPKEKKRCNSYLSFLFITEQKVTESHMRSNTERIKVTKQEVMNLVLNNLTEIRKDILLEGSIFFSKELSETLCSSNDVEEILLVKMDHLHFFRDIQPIITMNDLFDKISSNYGSKLHSAYIKRFIENPHLRNSSVEEKIDLRIEEFNKIHKSLNKSGYAKRFSNDITLV